jgi:hypothetical protein
MDLDFIESNLNKLPVFFLPYLNDFFYLQIYSLSLWNLDSAKAPKYYHKTHMQPGKIIRSYRKPIKKIIKNIIIKFLEK